ncbi:YfeC-like transcriptional regulator [Leclercia adecarboxylata]|jgi:excisionase family DNA binding protein|uniref:YfeC-like transcriptional regulator n=1 Tax=Leclercia adecarboxylata TaxID=83655 RepID=UPI003D29185A
MKKLRSKMTTEELAETLGVARQTVNRWVRKNGWKTEGINGVKGGRARLISIDAQVRAHISNIPAIRKRQVLYQLAESAASYGETKPAAVLPGITNALESMTLAEQERLDALLKREGVQGFLMRLSIQQPEE